MKGRRLAMVLAVGLGLLAPWLAADVTRLLERSGYDLRLNLLRTLRGNPELDERIWLLGLVPEAEQQGWTPTDTDRVIGDLLEAGAAGVLVFGDDLSAGAFEADPRVFTETRTAPGERWDLVVDEDGVVRRALLFQGKETAPAARLAAAAGATLPTRAEYPIFFHYPRTVSEGLSLELSYLTPLPLHDLDPALLELADGRIVVIGNFTYTATGDELYTPLGKMRGAEAQACLLDSLLQEFKLTVMPAQATFWLRLVVLGLLAWWLSSVSPQKALVGWGLFLLVLSLTSMLAFHLGVFTPMAGTLMGSLVVLGVVVGLQSRRGSWLIRQFRGHEGAELGGQERVVTIAFLSLPEYFKQLERQGSRRLLERRRQYNALVASICGRYGGEVLDYQGDAQMLGFGTAYRSDPRHHATAAAAAALELTRAVPTLGPDWSVSERHLLEASCGLCTGPVALGQVGSALKQDRAAIGDTTNTAARIMGAALRAGLPVVASGSTLEAGGSALEAEPLEAIPLKGKTEPVAIYQIRSAAYEPAEETAETARARGVVQTPPLTAPRVAVALASATLAFGLTWLLVATNLDRGLEQAAYNHRLELLRRPADPGLVIASIDESSLQALGPFPWTREIHAQVLRNLSGAGVKAVFFDLLFETAREDDPVGDLEFARAISDTGVAVLAGAATLTTAGTVSPPVLMPALDAETLRRSHGLGLINTRRDSDDQVRWAILAIDTLDGFYPSAALACLAKLTGHDWSIEPGLVRVGKRTFATSTEAARPNEIPILYPRGAYPRVSYHRLLDPESPALENLDGTVVLVGDGFNGPSDTFATPVGKQKGVLVHAAILDTLVSGLNLRALSEGQNLLIALVLCALTSWTFARSPGLGAPLAASLVLALAFTAVNLLAFAGGWWVGLAAPLVGVGLTATFALSWRYLLTASIFSRYVPPEVVDELMVAGQARDRLVTATVLVTDIRGYTSLSESRSPVEMLRLLNEYHRRTVACYARHGGVTLTYQGDAQLVVFGAVRRVRQPALAGVRAAQELQEVVSELCREWKIAGPESFEVGAGLCTGEVAVGVLGGEHQRQYTVVGETVRRAHAVQSLSTELASPVLMDEATWLACRGVLKGGRVAKDPQDLYAPA